MGRIRFLLGYVLFSIAEMEGWLTVVVAIWVE